ncbi:hypothetical protein EDI29_03215 [Pectobacterium polonicum]|nr:hypothetical protein EDI29_03215 [Pectobacterium polonicum]
MIATPVRPLKKGGITRYQQRLFQNCIERKGTAIRFQRKEQIMRQIGYILGAYLPIFSVAGSG